MPSVSISPPKNILILYQAMSIYTRTLPNNATTCTEMFSGIPASVGATLVGLKSTTSGVTENNELYEKGSLITNGTGKAYRGTRIVYWGANPYSDRIFSRAAGQL